MFLNKLKFKSLSKTLIGSSLIYTITNVLNAGINLMLIPVLTRHISPSEYGMLTIFSLLITFITPFVGMNIHGAITRKYFQNDGTDFKKYVGSCFSILLFSTAIVVLICTIFRKYFILFTDLDFKTLIFVIIICFAQFVNLTLLSIWQVKKKATMFGIFQIIFALINISLSIYFVANLNEGWEGRVYGQLIATIIMAIVAFYILMKNDLIRFSLDKKYMSHAIRFSLPLIPHSIGAVVISMTDRFIIKDLLGLQETGLYMLAYQFASVLSILTSAFNSAYIPWLFEKLNQNSPNINLRIVKLTYSIMACLLLLFILLIIVAKYLIPFFIGDDYLASFKYFPLLLLSFVFNGMYLLVTNYLFYAEKTKVLGYLTFFIAALNIPLTYYVIDIYPYNGAAISITICNFFMFLATWIFAAKYHKMPWSLYFFDNKKSNISV
jgi:O-antigen/teichoic acid export membrane protein